jgi:hypothetical protein
MARGHVHSTNCSTIIIICICIYSAFKTSIRRIQNIVNIQCIQITKYIKFEVPNIIIKIGRLHNLGLKYMVTDKVYKLNPSQENNYEFENDRMKPSRFLSMRLIGGA